LATFDYEMRLTAATSLHANDVFAECVGLQGDALLVADLPNAAVAASAIHPQGMAQHQHLHNQEIQTVHAQNSALISHHPCTS
jgi:hypothetical protein